MAVYELYDLKEYFQRISNDDENAFATIFDLFKKKVFAVAFKMLKSETEAEEIVQEAFLSLWRSRVQLNNVENPEGYIFKVAYHTIFAHLKKASRQQELLDGIIINLTYKQNTTQEMVAANETSRLIFEAIQLLPPQQRIILELAKLNDLSYAEIGEKLDLSKNTVKNHLVQAMKTIRVLLKNHITFFLFACLSIFGAEV